MAKARRAALVGNKKECKSWDYLAAPLCLAAADNARLILVF
jgi:hypothetical protein